jgi:hypothetical protein
MGNDGKQPGLSSTGILWLVLLGAGALFLREVPWQGSRPAVPEVKPYVRSAYQDVDARLWQDPMGAVSRAREEARNRQSIDAKSEGAAPSHAASGLLCAADDPRRKDKEVLVIGAMVSGAPYPERVEFRRRARYAILAGLNETGFVPADEEHLGYFLPKQQATPKPSEKPLPEFIAYEWLVPTESNLPGHSTVGTSPVAAKEQNVLLLWLDEDLFGDDPKAKVERVAASLTERCDPTSARLQFAVLGPSATWPLQNMISARAEGSSERPSPRMTVTFYAYGATADEQGLLADYKAKAGETRPASVHALLGQRDVALFRTIASDDQLAEQLARELDRRDVKPAQKCAENEPADCQHVVLIAERDSFYGRSLPWAMAKKLAGTNFDGADIAAYPHWIHSYSYLRGLDGQLPAQQPSSDVAKKDDAGSKPNGSTLVVDAKRIERPDGQGQFDYLRRLADQLVALDEDLRTQGRGSIRAIGVLGSDVYDKLLILQALRAQFPNAIVFTTDVEAIYLHPQQLEWTRNAIVASSFGLRLGPELQGDIPPFRDSYQTSLFLSTMIAVRHARARAQAGATACAKVTLADEKRCLGISQDQITTWLKAPRVFEIGRRSAFDFSAAFLGPSRPCTALQLDDCADIHPPSSAMFPEPSSRWIRVAFWLWVGLLLLWGLASGGWSRLGAWVFDPKPSVALISLRRLVVLTAGFVLVVLAAGLYIDIGTVWHGIGHRLTEGRNGEPFALVEGLSIWPTMILRAAALLLSFAFICRSWHSLNVNLDRISETLMSQEPRRQLMKYLHEREKRWPRWLRVVRVFSYRLREREGVGTVHPATGLVPRAERFWHKYIYQGRWWARFWRVLVATLAYLAVGTFVIRSMGGSDAPYRGALAVHLEPALRYASVFMMLFLIFFVVDATAFCYQLVSALRERLPGTKSMGWEIATAERAETRWPLQTLERFSDELGIDQRYLDDWITIHFVGDRTKAVAHLVYYPFIVIALMILSRSSMFDNWSTSIGLAIVITVSVAIVVTCAILLRVAAERLRTRAIWRLTNEKIPLESLRGDGARRALAQIDVMIGQIRAYERGAFAPYSQQPLVKAVLLPLTSYGGAALVEYLSIANF